MAFLRRKKTAGQEGEPDKLGSLLVQVSAHECGSFQSIWQRRLSDQAQVSLFAETAIFLIAFADRLAFEKFGDPKRSTVMNPLVDTIRDCFANQRHYGETRGDRARYFEHLLKDRMQKYALCSSIMGEGQGSLAFTGARHLVETFAPDVDDQKLPDVLFQTGKILANMIVALMMTPSFKELAEQSHCGIN